MSPAAADTKTEQSHDEIMRERIIVAAMECFTRLGIAKTSIQDVARVASVSRGTVYRYFPDRDALIEAGVEFGARQYYADAARSMARKKTLSKQMGAFAEVVMATQLEHRTHDRLMDGDSTLIRMVVSDRERTLQRHIEFIQTYVEAAAERGEIDPKTNVAEASEWLARIIMSLTAMQSAVSFDYRKPASAARFVERYAVAGLTGGA